MSVRRRWGPKETDGRDDVDGQDVKRQACVSPRTPAKVPRQMKVRKCLAKYQSSERRNRKVIPWIYTRRGNLGIARTGYLDDFYQAKLHLGCARESRSFYIDVVASERGIRVNSFQKFEMKNAGWDNESPLNPSDSTSARETKKGGSLTKKGQTHLGEQL